MKTRIFIGWDSAQVLAYDVCVHSIRKHCRSIGDLEIHSLRISELSAKYGWTRPTDQLQSTEFTYSRFLVPWLCNYGGLALFMDSDVVVLGDVTEVFSLDMAPYALRVVKHDHRPSETMKMGTKVQTVYPRKNWSSVMLMDCAKLHEWSKDAVATKSGAWLHRFEPIPDHLIGDLPKEWNVLDACDERTKLIHYTKGGPWLKGCEDHPCAEIWHRHRATMDAERTE